MVSIDVSGTVLSVLVWRGLRVASIKGDAGVGVGCGQWFYCACVLAFGHADGGQLPWLLAPCKCERSVPLFGGSVLCVFPVVVASSGGEA